MKCNLMTLSTSKLHFMLIILLSYFCALNFMHMPGSNYCLFVFVNGHNSFKLFYYIYMTLETFVYIKDSKR